MQCSLGNPESGLLNLETHLPALTIAKITLDENCFRTAQKTIDREPPSSKQVTQSTLKTNNQENRTPSGDLDIGLFILSIMDITYTLKIRPEGK